MPKLKIDWVKNVCGLGNGDQTCSFLMMGTKWECAKGTGIESVIQNRRDNGTMNAMGDNCSGPPDFNKADDAEAEA